MASVPQAVASIDGTFLDANNTFCTLTGFSREEILKKSFFNLTPPQELQETFSVVSELMGCQTSGGGYATRSFKKLCRMRYGVVEVFVSMSVIKNDDDSPAYFTCAVLPVTGTGHEQAAAVGSLAHHSNSSAASTRSAPSPMGCSAESQEPQQQQQPAGGRQQQHAKACVDKDAPPDVLPPESMRPYIVRSQLPAAAASAAVCSPGEGSCPSMLAGIFQQPAQHHSQTVVPQPAAPSHAVPGRPGFGAGTLRMPSIASVDTEAVLAGMQHSSDQFMRAHHQSGPSSHQPVSAAPLGIPVAPPNIFVAPVSGVPGNNSIAAFSLGIQDDEWREQDSYLADMTFDN